MRVIRYILFISLTLWCGVCFPGEERHYAIDDFSKGLNTQISEFSIPKNQCTEARNIRFNKVYHGVSKRDAMLQYGTIGEFAATGGHRYYQADETKQLIMTGSTLMLLGDDDAGTFSNIATGLSDGKRWTFVTYKDLMIGSNGTDQPIKYDGHTLITTNTDGHRTAENLTAELSAPFCELNTGTDLDASKWYQYKIAWYDGVTYTYSTAVSNPILTGADVHNILITGIPLGPTGTTHRYLYRTSGQATKAALATAPYYMVYAIADNTSTSQADTISDTTLETDRAPTWTTVSGGINVTPPVGKYLLIHDERLWSAGDPDNPSDMYWSDQFNPDYFTQDNIQVRPDDGDDITFMKEQLGVLTIGKDNSIQKFLTQGTSPANDWQLTDPYSFIGCIAPYSAVNSPEGIVYLGRKGLYVFNGQSTTLISDAVTPQIQDILETNLDNVVGTYWQNEYQISYTSNESGDTINNRILLYDFIRDSYTLDYKNVNCFIKFDSGTDDGTLYTGSSDADGLVYAQDVSTNDLIVRLKSEFNEGTWDDARVYGTEKNPIMEIAWTITIDEAVGTIDTHSYGDDAIIDRPNTDGTWTSPIYEINASQLLNLYWNEDLGDTGDVTLQVRSASTSGGIAAATWSDEFTAPTGSDLTGLTADDFIQLRVNMETSNILYSPELYVSSGYIIRLVYLKAGTEIEDEFFSYWESGWTDLEAPAVNKILKRIKVLYTGTSGTLTINYQNEEGDINTSFDIDLAQIPPYTDPVTGNTYTGVEGKKVFTYYPPLNETGLAPVGQFWKFSITNDDDDEFTINKIEVLYEAEQIFD